MSGDRLLATPTTRRRFLHRAAWLSGGLAAWAACGGGDSEEADVVTTLERTVVRDPDGNLVFGPGEPYTVRTDLAQAQVANRLGRDEHGQCRGGSVEPLRG